MMYHCFQNISLLVFIVYIYSTSHLNHQTSRTSNSVTETLLLFLYMRTQFSHVMFEKKMDLYKIEFITVKANKLHLNSTYKCIYLSPLKLHIYSSMFQFHIYCARISFDIELRYIAAAENSWLLLCGVPWHVL